MSDGVVCGRLATLATNYKTNNTWRYKGGRNLWRLAYSEAVGLQFAGCLLPVLVDTVRSVEAEKVLRVFLACLKVQQGLSARLLFCRLTVRCRIWLPWAS